MTIELTRSQQYLSNQDTPPIQKVAPSPSTTFLAFERKNSKPDRPILEISGLSERLINKRVSTLQADGLSIDKLVTCYPLCGWYKESP